MTNCTAIFRIGLLAVVLTGTFNTASAETLRVGGVGSAMAALPVLFGAFDRSEEIKLEVIPSLGSNGALRALSEGVLDIAVSGRMLKPEELAQGLHSERAGPHAVCPRYFAAAPEWIQEF